MRRFPRLWAVPETLQLQPAAAGDNDRGKTTQRD
ncbi:hypothetical protein CGRA01v4_08020 [Colletotrichum graminicola]|nr:hypothetical protein CGRA01v4_08020 [Colletotrichum graminicola]